MIEELLDYSELEGLIDPSALPSGEASRCFVSRGRDGKIEGYVFTQLIVTVEPIWVDEAARGSRLAFELFGYAIESLVQAGTVRYFITHSASDTIEDYLKRMGMTETGWKTFKMNTMSTGG
jgi:hypothetical protein